MAEHHYLGFKQFAGRGLRHVAEWAGLLGGAAGLAVGVFKCRPRDRWLGWHRSVRFRRLHLIGNTRFLVLPEVSGIPGLASRALSRSLRRLSADWREAHGHALELAETFRESVAVPWDVPSGVELDAGGSDAGLRAAQRAVHGHARFEQGDVQRLD